jgi:hypothetical protein
MKGRGNEIFIKSKIHKWFLSANASNKKGNKKRK